MTGAIRDIKQSTKYKKLVTSERDALRQKDLNKLRLLIRGYEAKIKVAEEKLAKLNPAPSTRRRTAPARKPIRHPPNPAKKRALEKVPDARNATKPMINRSKLKVKSHAQHQKDFEAADNFDLEAPTPVEPTVDQTEQAEPELDELDDFEDLDDLEPDDLDDLDNL